MIASRHIEAPFLGILWALEKVRPPVLLASIPVIIFAVAALAVSPRPKVVLKEEEPKKTYIEQVATKGDSFVERYGTADPEIIRVRTIPIRKSDDVVSLAAPPRVVSQPSPQPQSPVIETEEAVREPRSMNRRRHRVTRHASLDICARVGWRKEITRGGKSWRCRR